ncbi:PQQ-dependent sugar dehydrogenase [Methanosphaerula subterraneus]|uniref:PQQ-dependent sugar dehydrogenase n=1 Tax=Methanosphaerula subterraneus TaxID=3350244 RepID=UPI003F840343
MNRTTIALIAVLCMAMVALAVAAIPTGTSSPSGNATSTEHQFHPFTGTSSAIPGQIEAEDYDTGGQGIAWFDRTSGNEGGAYRQDDVDIETGGSGHVVAFVKSSEWLTYTVDIQEAGTYLATFRASSPWAEREVWVWVDGVLEAQVKVPDTKSFDTYEDATANVTLPAGSHYIRLQFVKDAQNLDYMTFEMAGGPSVTPTGNQTAGEAAIMITSPQNGTVVTPGNVTVTAMVSNFSVVDKQGQANVAGEGHVHFYMDVNQIPDTPGQPAIPTDPTAVWNHVSGTTYVFTNVTPGQHRFAVQLVNNDHTPVVPIMNDSVTVTATGTPTPTTTGNVTPTPTSDGGGGTVTPTPTGNVTPTPTPVTNVTDLTNQNSPLAAMIAGNRSTTMLQTSAMPIGLQRVAGNFTSPLFVAEPGDGSGRLFLVDQNGYVKIFFMNGTVLDQPFLDVRDRMVNLSSAYDERGLLSIAFHPNFSSNGKVYAYYSAPLRAGADPNWSCTNRLSEFTVSNASQNQVNNSSERILLEIDKPYMNHNGGILLFGPTDNYLYLTLGDGGRADDTGMGHTPAIGNGQDLTTLLGKVIRIDVDTTSAGKDYGIPAGNPFLSNATVLPEIYAYGFRNPAFAAFDSGGSNRMFVAMAGQNLFESALVIYKGGAYPWNIREGTHSFDPASDRAVPNTTSRITSYNGQPLIGPVVELGHDVGNVIVGGVVYRGSALSSLQGSYIFGTWSDSFTAGNGTLLVATPPAGLDTATLPDNAANLTAAENAMWTTSEMTVANNANGRINAFVRGMYENADHEVLVLINQNGGPGITPQTSGEVWKMVSANTSGLVPIGNASVAPIVTATATTTAPVTTTSVTTAATTPAGLTTSVNLTAQNLAFSLSTITVQAGGQVTVTFNNMDSGVPHNFAVYTDSSASTSFFKGPIVTGPVTTTYTFTAPTTPGTYFFRCDVHPTTMTGQFIVQ